MRPRPLRVSALLLVLAAGVAACALRTSPPALPPVANDAALNALAERDRLLNSLQTPVIMEYSGPRGHLKVREQLTVQRPASLRVEAMSALGVALIITADINQITVFNPSNNTLLRGPADAATLARFTQVPMTPAAAVRLLLALAPDNSILTSAPGSIAVDDSLRVFSYSAPGMPGYELGFSGGQLALVRQSDASGAMVYEVHYSGYQDIGALQFPLRVEARFASGATISLHYLDPLIDRPNAASLFQLTPGPGTRLFELQSPRPSARE